MTAAFCTVQWVTTADKQCPGENQFLSRHNRCAMCSIN